MKPRHLATLLATVSILAGCGANPDNFNAAIYGITCTAQSCTERGGTSFCAQRHQSCQAITTYPCYRCYTPGSSSSVAISSSSSSSSRSSSSVSTGSSRSGSSLSGSGSSVPFAGTGVTLCPGNGVCSKESVDEGMRCLYVPIACPWGSRRLCQGGCGMPTCHGICCFCISTQPPAPPPAPSSASSTSS